MSTTPSAPCDPPSVRSRKNTYEGFAFITDCASLGCAASHARIVCNDTALLDALAKELRRRETAWRSHWTGGGAKDVAKARFEAVKGRRDLFSALRTFAEHDLDTQAELDDVANIENDADLLQDLDRLATLAAKHEGDLAGTDVDAARVAQVAAATERFRVARAGAGRAGAVAQPARATEQTRANRTPGFTLRFTVLRATVPRPPVS